MSKKGKPSRRNYSVLLLYPDYLSDNYGQETYYTHVKSATPYAAVEAARQNAFVANKERAEAPDDFLPLAVIRGHIELELGVNDFT